MAPYFAAGAEVTNVQRLVFIGAQAAVDDTGAVVGIGDIEAQAAQVFANLASVLADANMTFANLVKTTTYIVNPDHVFAFVGARGVAFADLEEKPVSSLLIVGSLASPDFLVEVEAIAAEGA